MAAAANWKTRPKSSSGDSGFPYQAVSVPLRPVQSPSAPSSACGVPSTFSTLTDAEMLARVEFEGEERVRAAYAHGRGVLFVTGHFGYWELQGLAHALVLPPISVLARPIDNPRLHELLERAIVPSPPHLLRDGGLAKHHRDDRVLALEDRESERLDLAAEVRRVRVEPGDDRPVLRQRNRAWPPRSRRCRRSRIPGPAA